MDWDTPGCLQVKIINKLVPQPLRQKMLHSHHPQKAINDHGCRDTEREGMKGECCVD